MALIVQNTDTTTGLVLDPGDDLVINPGISVSAPGNAVTESTPFGDHDIAVLGSLAGGVNAIHMDGGFNRVSVGPGGSVFAGDAGIALSQGAPLVSLDSNEVLNDGLIHADFVGVHIAGGSSHLVVNDGTITAERGILISAIGPSAGGNRVINRGLVSSGNTAIAVLGTGNLLENTGSIVANGAGMSAQSLAGHSNTLINIGVITAQFGGMVAAEGDDTAVNAGRVVGFVDLGPGHNVFDGRAGSIVEGGINMGAGNDVVLNAGHIAGSVSLQGGQDSYDGRLGTVAGAVALGGGNDIARGGAGEEFLRGGDDEDFLFGNGGDDVLDGDAGNDRLDGGAGLDTLEGGQGDDIFFVDAAGDQIVEQAGEGTDEVRSTVAFTLADPDVENLTLLGGGSINAVGNGAANVLRGNSGSNLLDGRVGADSLLGGAGHDAYLVDNAGDVVTEHPGQGTDTVHASVSFALSDPDVENLTLLGIGALAGTGNALANLLTGNAGANTLDGFARNDRLLGLAGDDVLSGGLGNDRLDGGAGADRLIGGRGSDTLIGGAGADRFDFDAAVDSPRGRGRDTVAFRRAEGDEIYLAGIDARADRPGNQTFAFVGASAFTGADGQLRFAGGLLQGDINGDRIADFEIRIVGTLAAGDIIL